VATIEVNMEPIYLDNAAATPLDEQVFAAMQPYLTGQFYNPSAQYEAARAVKKDLESARARVAHWFGARPSEIIFTAGGTEANNLIINGIMQQYSEANLIVSSVEHDSILRPTEQYNHKLAPVLPDGTLDVQKCLGLIDDQTVLISVQYANNEVGVVQPIRQLAQAIIEIKKARKKQGSALPLLLHTDACQVPAYLDIHASQLGVDAITINSGKIYGPKQTGVLFVKAGTILQPQTLGGGQERGMRSGTENIANAVGMATALDLVQERRHEENGRMQSLQKLFFDLIEEHIPTAVINGSRKHRLPNNVHITLPGQDNERLMMELDEQGIQCAVGSACSASNEEPSHVLKAMGLSDADAQASLRFTMGIQTTEADIRRVVEALTKLV
jgi:cysteine desulfurase